MPSEPSSSTTILPDKPTVASLIIDLLNRMPVRARGFALSVSKKATDEEVAEIFRRLLTNEKQWTVRTRFYLGDAYNQMTKRRGARNDALQAIYKEFGKKYEQLLKTYGWVAAKWPELRRHDNKPWSHFVRAHPDDPEDEVYLPRPRSVINLKCLSSEERENGVLMVCENEKKRLYTVLIAREPTGDFTYAPRQSGYGVAVVAEDGKPE